MKKELRRAFSSPLFFLAAIAFFLCLQGYALPTYISNMQEPLEYRESALTLSLGGIFFGGVQLLLTFCSAMAYATNQVDDLRSGMMQWSVIRSSVRKYALSKMAACFLAAAVMAGAAFALHAAMWNLLALPYDPVAYPVHEIGFSDESFFSSWSTIAHALPIYIEICSGLAFSAGIWSVTALAAAVWVPDKLLTVIIPACVYTLWSGKLTYFLFGFRAPGPDILFNDAQTAPRVLQALAAYGILLLISTLVYYFGLRRRACHA